METYRKRLLTFIRDNKKGKDVHPVREPDEAEEAPDLMGALRASLEAAQKRGGRSRGGRKTSAAKGRGGGSGRKSAKKKAAA